MENATDALKMAFAVFIFTMALTISISMFSQLNQVSTVVLKSSDITAYYNYKEPETGAKNYRIVGLETIIPTLYKYYKENYTVVFLEANGKPTKLYTTQTDPESWGSGLENGDNPNKENIAKYYIPNVTNGNYQSYKDVCSFDVDEETIRHEPWTGTNVETKKNLDAFLGGGTYINPTGSGTNYGYGNGFIAQVNNTGKKLFKEMLGEYEYKSGNQTKKKRVIVYQKNN